MILTVISHYAARQEGHLNKLLNSISQVASEIAVVRNVDGLSKPLVVEHSQTMRVLSVPNRGMNIGAWNEAYRAFPNYQYYIFLQDECMLRDPFYQERYVLELSTSGVGMTGESINQKWCLPWGAVKSSQLNYKIGNVENGSPIDRVSFYLRCFERWGIDPGETASHLRALAWGFSNDCLRAIKRFPIGAHKEECIAAEIAVSRAVVSEGFRFSQIGVDPFSCFEHFEWKLNGSSKRIVFSEK